MDTGASVLARLKKKQGAGSRQAVFAVLAAFLPRGIPPALEYVEICGQSCPQGRYVHLYADEL
jgi:hypothetical protein